MKNKFLMSIAAIAIALGVTGCTIGKTEPATPLSESGQTKYIDYSETKFNELRGSKKFAVFFHAQWCGTCRSWEKNIIESATELSDDAIILKVNYDEETELAKELHVNSQSTVVFFDEKGEITDNIVDPKMGKMKEFFAETEVKEVMNEEKEKMEDSEKEEEIAGKTANPAKYVDYSVATRQAATGKKHLIFFYADWCGTCKAWEKKLKNGLADMPDGTVVLKADYDNDLELKKEFGISTQSTAVFINADGTVAKKVIDPKINEVTEFFAN